MFFALAALLQLAALIDAQTVYLAGDSTMAKNGAGSGTGTDGWGQFLGQYLNIPVVNQAVGGESARSFADQDRFTTLVNSVQKGDFAIIEFGHNDGTAGSVDNGKQDAVGDGYDITSTVTSASGQQILIHSFAYYIENAINPIKAKGGIPIISSVTPDNIWSNGKISGGGRFVTYAQSIGRNESIIFVDHNAYTAQAYNVLGETTVDTFYPNDHLHTSPAGANVIAQAFVRGLLCSKTSTLIPHVNSAGQNVPNGGPLKIYQVGRSAVRKNWTLLDWRDVRCPGIWASKTFKGRSLIRETRASQFGCKIGRRMGVMTSYKAGL